MKDPKVRHQLRKVRVRRKISGTEACPRLSVYRGQRNTYAQLIDDEKGVTMLAVDSIFMMPQLGVLSVVHPEAAAQVFERDCLIKLGSVIAPVGKMKPGEIACSARPP